MLQLHLLDFILVLSLNWIDIFKLFFFLRNQDFKVLVVLRQKVSKFDFSEVFAFLLVFYEHRLNLVPVLQFLDVIQDHERFFIVLLFSDQILLLIKLVEIIYLPLNLVMG